MSDENAIAVGTPTAGRVVDDAVLVSNNLGSYGRTLAFGGAADPLRVWQTMVSGERTAIEYYRELEAKDDTVADAVEEMKRSVLKRNLAVVPVDENNSAAADIAGFIQTQFDNLTSWRNTLEAILDAPFYGYSIAEKVFDISAGQVSLLDIRDCPQELFSFNSPLLPQTGQLRLHRQSGSYDGELMPESKFIVWSSRMRAGDRRGRPLLKEVYWPSWFNRNVIRFWLRLTERGPGTAVTEYQNGATQQAKDQALAAAEALVNQVAMAVEEGFVIRDEFLKVARSQDPAAYAQLSDRMESKIIRRIVGSTLTSKGSDDGKGTQALGKVHQDTKEERSVEYTLQLESILNQQLVQQLVLWNFGPDAPMVKVRLDKSDEEDLGARITVDATAQQMGTEIPESYMRNKYGIPAPKAGENVIVRSTAPTMPTLTTPAGVPDAPQFADTAIAHQVTRDQSDFDKLFTQFRKKGVEIYGQQIDDLAKSALKQRNDA